MKVKVQCNCGTRFEFEVEPVNHRMPMPINCPGCDADATALANEIIRQQSSAAPTAPPARLSMPAVAQPPMAANPPPPPPPPAPQSGLRISKSHASEPAAVAAAPSEAVESASAEPAVQVCAKHKSEPAIETCRACGKPMCRKCMEQFGYVCSVWCRQQAEKQGIDVPVYGRQKNVVAHKSYFMAKCVTWAVSLAVVALLGFWFWYAWFARKPQIVYTIPITKTNIDGRSLYIQDADYELIGPGQLLTIKNQQVSLFDVARQQNIWASPLQTEAEAAAVKAAREKNEKIMRITPKVMDHGFDVTDYPGLDPLGFERDDSLSARVLVSTNDVWLAFPQKLLRFDRQTGSRKELAIKDQIQNVIMNDDSILVVSGSPGGHESLTEIMLPEGSLQTEDITDAQATKTMASGSDHESSAPKTKRGKSAENINQVPVGQLKALAAQSTAPAETDEDAAANWLDEERRPFIATGPNVVQFKTKLLEHKTIAHEAMKPKGKSILDSGNVTASQGLDLAQEMANDARRAENGGKQEEDVSRYEVTIHRRFAGDIPDWTGEVTGPPQFFALKTVDVVAAGQTIYVFDKNNKKLWEAKLTFSVPAHYSTEYPPCLETKDALYFADLGMLTRYDTATGNVRWRYNSVGISRIQADDRGGLYVNTTTAGPESIQYSQQVNIHDKIHPVIVKVAPESGKELWRLVSTGDHCLISGKFVYSYSLTRAYAALHLEEGPDTHYYLNLLAPASGDLIWSFHRGNQLPVKTEVQKNWILIHFENEVLVLKFFSL